MAHFINVLHPTAPSIPPFHQKRKILENGYIVPTMQRGHVPSRPRALSRERYVRDSEEKEGKQDILYSWTRAREIHCDEFTKRDAISMASFSLKQLSIGFPLEEFPPLPSACAATMRTTWSLFSALRGG